MKKFFNKNVFMTKNQQTNYKLEQKLPKWYIKYARKHSLQLRKKYWLSEYIITQISFNTII